MTSKQQLVQSVSKMRMAVISAILRKRRAHFVEAEIEIGLLANSTDKKIVNDILRKQSLWFKISERFFSRKLWG